MSVTTLRPRRPHATGRRQLVHALLPPRTADDLQRFAASRGWSTAETVELLIADFFLAQRRKRDPGGDRAAVLRQLEAMGCSFAGPVERRHRLLARRLEAIDERLDSA